MSIEKCWDLTTQLMKGAMPTLNGEEDSAIEDEIDHRRLSFSTHQVENLRPRPSLHGRHMTIRVDRNDAGNGRGGMLSLLDGTVCEILLEALTKEMRYFPVRRSSFGKDQPDRKIYNLQRGQSSRPS